MLDLGPIKERAAADQHWVPANKFEQHATEDRAALVDEVERLRAALAAAERERDEARAALTETRSALDAALDGLKIASKVLCVEREACDEWRDAIRQEYANGLIDNPDPCWALGRALDELTIKHDARRAAEKKP